MLPTKKRFCYMQPTELKNSQSAVPVHVEPCLEGLNSNPESGTAVLVISLVISPVADGEGRSVMVWCSISLSLMA